jgi:hypothetical protein
VNTYHFQVRTAFRLRKQDRKLRITTARKPRWLRRLVRYGRANRPPGCDIVVLQVTARGADGRSPFRYSLDSGENWSEERDAIPGSVFDMGGGITLTFDGGTA